MAKTKKQIVKELINLGVDESESQLMKKNVEKLQIMLDKFEGIPVEDEVTAVAPMLDMEAMKREMMAQMKAELEAQIRAEMMAEAKSQSVVEVKKAPTKVTEIDRNRQVPLMNITPFSLVYVSPRTGAEWNWDAYGDIEYMEMSEIMTMRSSQKRFLDFPFVLVMDEDAISYLGLDKEYDKLEKLIDPKEIDKVFRMRMDDFKNVIDNAPKGVQVLIVGRAKHLIGKGELDSMHKVNYINDKFNTDLVIESV